MPQGQSQEVKIIFHIFISYSVFSNFLYKLSIQIAPNGTVSKIDTTATVYKSVRLRDNPALVKIITNAICLKSPDIARIDSSTILRQYGLIMIPTIIIPKRLGSFIFEKIQPANKPNNKISEMLVNI